MTHSDITLREIENQFSDADGQVRLPRFCNAAILAEIKGPVPCFPRLDDSPGADGGFDASWTLPEGPTTANASPFAVAGLNAIQYKARNASGGPGESFQRLKQSVKGAVRDLVERSGRPGELQSYTLFTNLGLGRPERSRTKRGVLSSRRDELIAALKEGLPVSENVIVSVLDGAFLQGVANRHAAIRETFFGTTLFQNWNTAWKQVGTQPHAHLGPLVGRASETAVLRTKIADRSIAFIGLSGASGMGKTRLVLEATRDSPANILFVRSGAKATFLARNLDVYASGARWVFVVEDLRFGEAKQLAEQAVLHPGLCIVATIPAEEHLPRLGLGDSPAIYALRVPPLGSDDARALLRAAGSSLDFQAKDWVIQEAGGNPQIILVAAALGADLRQKTGWLRRQVARSFLTKAKDLLGAEVEPVLEMLSVLSPFDVREEAHVRAVQETMGLAVTGAEIRQFRDRLVDAALVESSGHSRHELTVSPPLLAGFFFERLLEGQSNRALTLFERLDEDGRARLLDRLVSVEPQAGQGLWEYVFGPRGPFAPSLGLQTNVKFLRLLARAAPRQTVDFLQLRADTLIRLLGRRKHLVRTSLTQLLMGGTAQSRRNHEIDEFRTNLMAVFRVLLDHADSSRGAMVLLEKFVIANPDSGGGMSSLFAECFIASDYRFPVSPKERWSIILRLTRSTSSAEQEVGFAALFVLVDPPSTTSWPGPDRRRMGEHRTVTNGQVWDFSVAGFDLLLATAISEGPFRARALDRMPGALSELRRLPPARVMPLLRRLEDVFWRKKIELIPVQLLGCWIHTRERFQKLLVNQPGSEWVVGVPEFIGELERMIERLEKGPLALRLQIWLDRHPGAAWKLIPGTDKHRFLVELEAIASEVVSDSSRFTAKTAALLVGERASHSADFAFALGKLDVTKRFWPRIAALQKNPGGAWIFGSYCEGVATHDRTFVDTQLDRAMPYADGDMLTVLKRLGPNATNRRRVLKLVRERKVTPIQLAGIFRTGRWLDQLPISEVQILMRYMASDRSPAATYDLLHVFSLYLHPTGILPRPLLPIAQALLLRRCAIQQDTEYYCDALAENIAKTDISTGVRLFQRLMTRAAEPRRSGRGWNPVSGFDGSMDFYSMVAEHNPTVAYSAVLRYLGTGARYDVLNDETVLFDVERHRAALLQIAANNAVRAKVLCKHLILDQPGFWEFLSALVEARPHDGGLREAVTNLLSNDLPWSYPSQGRIDASLRGLATQLTLPTLPAQTQIFFLQVQATLTARRPTTSED